jgi:hypothetical protein
MDHRVIEALEKALSKIYEDRSLLRGCPSTRGDDIICVENLADWSGNHLFDDHPEDFDLDDLEGHRIRAYFQTNGSRVNTHDHIETRRSVLREVYGYFPHYLEGERKEYLERLRLYPRERLEFAEPRSGLAEFRESYELDRQGLDQKRVKQLYQKAIEKEHHNIDYWAKYLCFLIIVADHNLFAEEWQRCRHGSGNFRNRKEVVVVYSRLHYKIVATLLHRARLFEAREILGEMDRNDDGFQPYWDRLLALEHVNRGESSVFPIYIPYSEWWKGPHLVKWRWFPARISAKDVEERVIYLETGIPPDKKAKAKYGSMKISYEKWDRWCKEIKAEDVEVGRFLELYELDEEDSLIKLHKRGVPDEITRPFQLELPSHRYLKRWQEEEFGK